LTSTFLAPPSPSKLPANVAASAETARLQARLLQLSLLHRAAAPNITSWHASAKGKLGTRFKELAWRSGEVEAEEREVEEEANARALRHWGEAGVGGLEDRVQALDAVISGVWALGEAGGRYARLVRKFQAWVGMVRAVLEARRSCGDDGDGLPDSCASEDDGLLFLPEPDAGIVEERTGVRRKLLGWKTQLDSLEDGPGLGDADPPSSLARMLDGCRALVGDMLAELEAMEHIEREAAAQEKRWMEGMLADEDEGVVSRGSRAGAIWRVV
jgi:hypothetical protein